LTEIHRPIHFECSQAVNGRASAKDVILKPDRFVDMPYEPPDILHHDFAEALTADWGFSAIIPR
jgi:hypothetical protein